MLVQVELLGANLRRAGRRRLCGKRLARPRILANLPSRPREREPIFQRPAGLPRGNDGRSDRTGMSAVVNWGWLPPIFAQASERISGSLGELAGGATVWLAVTGLSRSGKTVFVTSLIHNLLSCAHNLNRMPLLGVVGERRLIAATIEAARANQLPQFPYLDNIERMAIADWPARTEGISQIGIEVRFAPAGTLGNRVTQTTGRPPTVTIRFIDYPGEWLLDLPLIPLGYAEWSRATLRLLRKGLRAEIARDFLALLAQHP